MPKASAPESLATTLRIFLKALETRVPLPPGIHHTISYMQYGSPSAGFEDRLGLQMRGYNPAGEMVSQVFFLTDEDLAGPVDELVDSLVQRLVV